MRQDRCTREIALNQLSDIHPDICRAQQHRALAGGSRLDRAPYALHDIFGQARLQSQVRPLLSVDDRVADALFDIRTDCEDNQIVLFTLILLADRAPQGLAAVLRQDIDVLGHRGIVGQRLENAHGITHRNALLEQVLHYFLDLADRKHFGHKLFDNLRMSLGDRIEESLGLLAAQELMGMRLDNFGKMGGQDGGRVDNRVAGKLRSFALRRFDPARLEVQMQVRV